MTSNESEDFLDFTERGSLTNISRMINLSQKDFVSYRDDAGCNALMFASLKGHQAMVQYLVEELKADLSTRANSGESLVFTAAFHGNTDVVRYLAECGANVNCPTQWGDSPLYIAALKGHIFVVKYLAENHEADVHFQNADGYNALLIACQNGHYELVQYLLEEQDADLDAVAMYDYTCLHLASKCGRYEIVKYLIENHHVDINARDKNGATPLMLASYCGQLQVVKYLVEETNNLADIYATDEDGQSARDLVCKWYTNNLPTSIEQVKQSILQILILPIEEDDAFDDLGHL